MSEAFSQGESAGESVIASGYVGQFARLLEQSPEEAVLQPYVSMAVDSSFFLPPPEV